MPEHHRRSQTHPAPMPHQRMAGPVVAGVVPGQSAIVIRQSAALAYSLGVGLVFAYVDVTRYLVEEHDGADDTSAAIDPDGVDERDDVEGAARSIKERISTELGDGESGAAEPGWSFVTLAGEPARSLARLAESVHACVIVVGTRERGVGARLEEFLIGSVAVHLTHRQHRPVLVIPLDPHAPPRRQLMAERTPPTEASPEQGIENLPVDSDVDAPGQVPGPVHRPIHLHPWFVLLVVVGGCVGALSRYGLSRVLPAPDGWPLPTLLINIAGAFALGALLEGLSRRGADTGRLRLLRLLVGTGFMGAFTTYSTLAVDAVHLFDAGAVEPALLYLAASLFGGIGAALAGIWVAAWHHRSLTERGNTTLVPAGPGEEK